MTTLRTIALAAMMTLTATTFANNSTEMRNDNKRKPVTVVVVDKHADRHVSKHHSHHNDRLHMRDHRHLRKPVHHCDCKHCRKTRIRMEREMRKHNYMTNHKHANMHGPHGTHHMRTGHK